MTEKNQRLHQRARVLLPVVVRLGDNEPPIHAVATDLSEGGLFLLDDARIAKAERAALDVDIDGEHHIQAEARVVRQQKPERPRGLDVPGVALQFVALPGEVALAIKTLVDTRAA